jgi:hypothetical protein
MKNIFLCAALFVSIGVSAQTIHKSYKKAVAKRSHAKTTIRRSDTSDAVILSSSSTANALSGTSASNQFTITDPVTNILNAKANGAQIDVGKSGIMGMPKRAFGFANGHLTLKPNSSTTSGTINGDGSVGTGSFAGSAGTGSMVPGVNGKNPYAGVDIWGTHLTGSGIKIKEQGTSGKRQ